MRRLFIKLGLPDTDKIPSIKPKTKAIKSIEIKSKPKHDVDTKGMTIPIVVGLKCAELSEVCVVDSNNKYNKHLIINIIKIFLL